MDLSQYSNEQLMQIAGVNKTQNNLSGYSDEELMKIAGITPQKEEKYIAPNLPKASYADVLKGTGKGVLQSAERLANGATFGGYDFISDKLGLGARQRAKEFEEQGGTPAKVLNVAGEIVGSIPSGVGLYKGVATGLKNLSKVATKATLPLTGAIEGGTYSGFNTNGETILPGAVTGAAFAGAMGALGKGLGAIKNKVFPNLSLGGIKPTLEGAVESAKGRSLLNKGIRKSNLVAGEIYNQSIDALSNVNRQSNETLQKALGTNRVSIADELAKAKKSYADFIDARKGQQVVTPSKEQLASYPAESKFNIPAGITEKDAYEILSNRAKQTGIEIGGNPRHYTKKRDRRIYTRTLSNTLQKPDITYSQDGKDYIIKKYNGVSRNGEKPFFDFIVKKDGKLETKFKPDDLNYIYNQLIKKPVNNMSIYERTVPKAEGTYPQLELKSGIKGIMPNGYTDVKQKLTSSSLGLDDMLSNYQKNALNTAWKGGADQLKKDEVVGSLKHIDEVKKSLNNMIEQSKVANPNGFGTVDTSNTVALREIKDLLKDTMNKSGLSDVNKEYARAKGLESLFNEGRNFNPNKNTLAEFNLDNADKKSAFLQGIVKKLTTNPEAHNLAENAMRYSSAIKELSPNGKEVIGALSSLSRKHKDISGLSKKAYNKIGAGTKDDRPWSETLESGTSLLGQAIDTQGRKVHKNAIEKAVFNVLGDNIPKRKKGILERTLFKDIPKKDLLESIRAIAPLGSGNLINIMTREKQ